MNTIMRILENVAINANYSVVVGQLRIQRFKEVSQND